MKRSTNKLYKPWFGIAFALTAVILVLACGGTEVDKLKIDPNVCSEGDTYDTRNYSYTAKQIRSEIVDTQSDDRGQIYIPYLDIYYDESYVQLSSNSNATIDHIVARRNAHDSGLCNESVKVRREFASDLLNITLASAKLNNEEKGSKTADGWVPANNKCWFAYTIVKVKNEYNLVVTPSEKSALNRIWNSCNGDFRLEKDR